MNLQQAQEMLDRWGTNPDEWFVSSVDLSAQMCRLSKSPGGRVELECLVGELERPDIGPEQGLLIRANDLVRRR